MSDKKQKIDAPTGPECSSRQDPEESSGLNRWQSLSDEMVLSVLRLLTQEDLVTVSLINKKFRDLSRDDSLWTELTLDYEDIKQNTDSCRKLVDRCKKLSKLKITNMYQNWKRLDIMSVVIRTKSSLKCLEVDDSMRDWTPAAMSKLGHLENLTSLALSINTKRYAVNEYKGAEMLEELAKLHQLEKLKLVIAHKMSGTFDYKNSSTTASAVMKKVFQQLKKLKEVDIFPDTGMHAIYHDGLMEALARNNPALTVLHLKGSSSLSDRTIDVLASSCPRLEELTISFSPSERSIQKLSSSCPNLKCLEVGRDQIIDHMDTKLIGYVEKFKRLESLVLHGYSRYVTDKGVETLLGVAKKLKHLTLTAPRVTKDLVERLKIEYPDIDLKINLALRK